jgi:hypothetical protein
MKRGLGFISIVVFALDAGLTVGGSTSSLADEAGVEARVGELRGAVLSLFAPAGAVATETNPNYKSAAAPAPAVPPSPAAADWPSYNKTLTSERFSNLGQINTKNVAKLKVLWTYDTWRLTSFETGPIMVEGALIGTTEFDIFSIDPSTCAESWRTHEEYPAYILPTNRGVAYLDGRLFRGTDDGRVLAYDFKTGKRLWETTIADVKKGESVPAAPIAWEGLVFIGNAGGDSKAPKGTCTRSTPRPARLCGNSSSRPRPGAILFAGLSAPRRSTPRPGRISRVLRSVVAVALPAEIRRAKIAILGVERRCESPMSQSCPKHVDGRPTAAWRARMVHTAAIAGAALTSASAIAPVAGKTSVMGGLAMASFHACALRCDPSQIHNSGFPNLESN